MSDRETTRGGSIDNANHATSIPTGDDMSDWLWSMHAKVYEEAVLGRVGAPLPPPSSVDGFLFELGEY